MQAWQVLRELGVQPDSEQERRVLGVVVEVAMGGGLDMVAAYEDLSARYYNFSGAAVIWEHPDDTLDGIIRAVLSAGGSIAQAIGPWEGDRPAAPPKDHVRLNILTPSGLMFGQAPMGLMASDPVGGQLVTHATELMQKLIAKTQAQSANV